MFNSNDAKQILNHFNINASNECFELIKDKFLDIMNNGVFYEYETSGNDVVNWFNNSEDGDSFKAWIESELANNDKIVDFAGFDIKNIAAEIEEKFPDVAHKIHKHAFNIANYMQSDYNLPVSENSIILVPQGNIECKINMSHESDSVSVNAIANRAFYDIEITEDINDSSIVWLIKSQGYSTGDISPDSESDFCKTLANEIEEFADNNASADGILLNVELNFAEISKLKDGGAITINPKKCECGVINGLMDVWLEKPVNIDKTMMQSLTSKNDSENCHVILKSDYESAIKPM